ncbi:UDP-Glycosyltransferase superfamily protein [Euphorbia peplus]|nr:UDP-Glycosyltransferase superfamily protein [Euphorbia peplus]
MEEVINRGDLHVNVVRQSPLRPNGSAKSTISGRSTPRNSPTFRRLNSSRTPRREGRSFGGGMQWFRSSRIVYWLLLITLWAYLGFYVQSRWAHGDNKDDFLGFGGQTNSEVVETTQGRRRDLLANESSLAINKEANKVQLEDVKEVGVVLNEKENRNSTSPKKVSTSKKRNKRSERRLHSKKRIKQKTSNEDANDALEVQEPDIPQKNSTYRLLVGPFGTIEDRVLEWSPERRTGTCDRKGQFARLVWSRKFVLIFHELSMTGAPLSMMELASEFLSCGATVSAVVLSKKGGLMPELARRRIKVIEDKADLSFKTAMKADLVIAGSAVCASWIDQYMTRFPAGGSQVVWWIMENRREYFDRAKLVLNRVKMLAFLSESQSKQWLSWCGEENITLRSPPSVVPLSITDELAFTAGISCSLNTPIATPEKMQEKRQLLRNSVRKEMGLAENDVLMMSLSSINPGKGQLLLLESVQQLIERQPLQKLRQSVDKSTVSQKNHLRALLEELNDTDNSSSEPKKRIARLTRLFNRRRRRSKVLSNDDAAPIQNLKVLIGSVGSKSNKVLYVKEMLSFISQHTNLSKSVIWTPSTTRVASLYSAADIYVINSQGLGETFGRVTIEAMAFGLPVLGTDGGGTKEIVEHNVTGLVHPVGHPGTRVLAQNIQYLLKNPSLRGKMGMNGKKKVKTMYLKRHMYKKFAEVLYKCMRVK